MAEQRWDPDQYASHARFVAELGEPLLELLAPRSGERVLDLGCGDGALTEKLVAAGCRVVAVDKSPEQVAAAAARGLDARVEDAERLSFADEFDGVLSNAVLHWVRDQDAMLAGVQRALRPAGRFVGELGGAGNVDSIRSVLYDLLAQRGIDAAALDPWFFPTAEAYGSLLSRHGFDPKLVTLFERPTPLPGDIGAWLEVFAQPFLGAVGARDRQELIDEVRQRLRPRLHRPGHGWSVDYVRLRFSAVRSA